MKTVVVVLSDPRTAKRRSGGDHLLMDDVFHEGEIAVQERAGERSVALRNGRMIADIIPPGARPFLAQQRMILMAHGDLWASVVFGDAGFVSSDDGAIVSFDHGLPEGCPVGLLAIDFATRRRFRINGDALPNRRVRVRQAFPNCPKYIRRRRFFQAQAAPRGASESGTTLDTPRATSIALADTLFIASRHPQRGMDASHRGGPAGFIQVKGNTLTIPDYPGNGMFNTIGNLEVDPAAGVTVMDFDRGRVLEMTGVARAWFDEERPAHPAAGTGRYWSLHVREWREYPVPPTYRWEIIEASSGEP